jgi:1,4-dihydroxy-2-naphthoate octaprenyltransferase
MMLQKSTLQLLRVPFSLFLMPVFWFSLSSVPHFDIAKAVLIFLIIHLLVYPSSNGYNSYMDRDTESIGGIEHPMAPEKELYYVTIALDGVALVLGLLVSVYFAVMLSCYIICSRLYSYRGIRLKRFAIIGYLTVILNQGGLLFLMVYFGTAIDTHLPIPWLGICAACFLIGGFYPITQVYQHAADKRDGVHTISMLLGKRGTFIFCAVMYLIAFGFLFLHYQELGQINYFLFLQIFFLPVLVYFIQWVWQVWRDPQKADFAHTMRMNWVASSCTNLGFITLLILHYFG